MQNIILCSMLASKSILTDKGGGGGVHAPMGLKIISYLTLVLKNCVH